MLLYFANHLCLPTCYIWQKSLKVNKKLGEFHVSTQCLKITEKVSFNNAGEASYVYILSGQKLIKNAKKWSILASF